MYQGGFYRLIIIIDISKRYNHLLPHLFHEKLSSHAPIRHPHSSAHRLSSSLTVSAKRRFRDSLIPSSTTSASRRRRSLIWRSHIKKTCFPWMQRCGNCGWRRIILEEGEKRITSGSLNLSHRSSGASLRHWGRARAERFRWHGEEEHTSTDRQSVRMWWSGTILWRSCRQTTLPQRSGWEECTTAIRSMPWRLRRGKEFRMCWWRGEGVGRRWRGEGVGRRLQEMGILLPLKMQSMQQSSGDRKRKCRISSPTLSEAPQPALASRNQDRVWNQIASKCSGMWM